MTDARLPDQWLGHPRFEGVQPETWVFFINCLMWSNRYGTDGNIPRSYAVQMAFGWNLDLILLQLENAGVCKVDSAYIQFHWLELGQSPASEVEARREKNRERQRIKRERQITRGAVQAQLEEGDIF